jgi:hypothetical protein
MSAKTKLPRMRVAYYDEASKSDDVIVVGAWELTLANRKYGDGAIGSGDLEAMLYAVWQGAKRCGVAPANDDFEAWASTVAILEEDGEGESQAPPAT